MSTRDDEQKQAFNAALGAVTEFYNNLVADLRKQLAQAEKERDQWKAIRAPIVVGENADGAVG